jgi:hypothetical protein
MRARSRTLARLGSLALLAAAGCAASSNGPSIGSSTGTAGFGAGSGDGGNSGTIPTGSGGSAGSSADAGVPLPPEMELESSFEVPVATGHLVWVANPTSGRVAYVDASALTVKTIEAGNGPTYLAPLPGAGDAVIVLNVLSNDATVLRASGGTLTSQTVPGIAPTANGWAMSPDGRWAIAWTDVRRVTNPRPSAGYQDATVVDLAAADPSKAATTLAVGFRPVSFSFSADSKRAFAVTEDGVSIVALGGAGGPAVTGNVALEDDPTADADTRDVSITADGRLALVRREGSSDVVVVDLAAATRTKLTLDGAVTDLDVTADGTRAVAVVRDASEVAVIPLAAGVPAASAIQRLTITGETVGQAVLSDDGSTAVLFSNAIPDERLTVVTLADPPTFHVLRVHAPVLSAFAAPNGDYAVVLHPADAAPGTQADAGAAQAPDGGVQAPPVAGAFSLVQLDGSRPARIEPTDAPIQTVSVAPASDRALITLRDDAKQIFAVYLGQFATLVPQRIPLASPPIAAGVVAGAGRGYVAQQHPDGRITFVTLDGEDTRTITGYELASRVVDWSTQ